MCYCLYSPGISRTRTLHYKVLPGPLIFKPWKTTWKWSSEAEGEQLGYNKSQRIVQILFLQRAFHKTKISQLSSLLEWWHLLWGIWWLLGFLDIWLLILTPVTLFQFYSSFYEARVLVTHAYFYCCFGFFETITKPRILFPKSEMV